MGGESKANSTTDDGRHNNATVPAGGTVPTYDEPTNNSNNTKIDDVDYDNGSHSSGNAAKSVSMKMCVLYMALALVLLSMT